MLTSKQAIKKRTDDQEPVATREDIVETEDDEEIHVRHEKTEERKGQHANATRTVGELDIIISGGKLIGLQRYIRTAPHQAVVRQVRTPSTAAMAMFICATAAWTAGSAAHNRCLSAAPR